MSSPSENIELLLSRYFAHELSPAEAETLQAWLRSSPDNANHFARAAIVQQGIRDILIAEHLQRTARQSLRRNRSRWTIGPRPLAAACIAAAVMISALSGWFLLSPRAATVHGTARITETIDATWTTPGLATGSALPSGVTNLRSGAARLMLPDNTEAIIQAPAEFIFEDRHFSLTRGKAVFLSVATPQDSVKIRVGTAVISRPRNAGVSEFGVNAPAGELPVIQVFSGSVNLDSNDGPTSPHSLTADSGPVRLTDLLTASATANFLHHADFCLLARAKTSPWAARRLALKADPHLLFCSDLTLGLADASVQGRVFALGSANLPPLVSDDLTAPVAEPGRDPADPALSFTRDSQSLRANIPGSFQSLTLAAWVRLYPEDLARYRHRGMVMADGWNKPGLIHWQLKGSGFRLSFYEKGDDKDPRSAAGSDALWDGSWHFIASVITLDPSQPSVTHYVDGERVGFNLIPQSQVPAALRLGPCSIGGWRPYPGDDDPDRHLNGALDDLLLFDRPLSSQEIRQLYLDSK